jgi:hypothetical protein
MNYESHHRAETLAIVLGVVYCLAVIIWSIA